jgi:uncharacterized damage-inducible protein DinB
MNRVGALLVTVAVAGCAQPAPEPAPAPPPSTAITDSLKAGHEIARGYVTAAADQMAEADFAFKPARVAAEVRTFGQIVGHIADANFMFCSMVSGEANPNPGAEKMAAKADITKALGDAFAFCDRAIASVNDQSGADPVRIDFLNRDFTKLGVIAMNTAHNMEHYGNLVTYMRAKGMVPPSSAPQGGN